MLDLNANTQIQNFDDFANSSDLRYPLETKNLYLLNDRYFGENKLETSTENVNTSDAVASDAVDDAGRDASDAAASDAADDAGRDASDAAASNTADDAGRDASDAAASYALNTTGKNASTAVASNALDDGGRDALYATGEDTSNEGSSEAPNVTARDNLKENLFVASNISGNYNPELLNVSESEPEGSNNAEDVLSDELNKKDYFVQFDQVIKPRGVNMLNTPEEMEKRFR